MQVETGRRLGSQLRLHRTRAAGRWDSLGVCAIDGNGGVVRDERGGKSASKRGEGKRDICDVAIDWEHRVLEDVFEPYRK